MASRIAKTLAVVSDIHGNSRALSAVLADIDRRRISDIANLGDCAYGPFDPCAVLDEIMKRDIPTVSGNEDRVLVEASQGMSHSRTALFSVKWLEGVHLEWLAKLPVQLFFDDVTLFHGVPGNDTTYLLTAVSKAGVHPRSRGEIAWLVSGIASRILLCGHDHMPCEMALDGEQTVVNPGSVGCPAYTDDSPYDHVMECGTPHARYAVLEIRDDALHVDFVQVRYDWNAAAAEAAANGFPDWAHWIRTGRT